MPSQRSVPVKRKQGDMNMDVDSDFADAMEAGDDVACDVSQTSEQGENVACRMELEITDEMLDFFATSQKHRKQRGMNSVSLFLIRSVMVFTSGDMALVA